MFSHRVFPAQVFADVVFPDALAIGAAVSMVDLIGALNMQSAFGGTITRTDLLMVELVGAINAQSAFGGTVVLGQPMVDLLGSLNGQFIVGGTIDFTQAGQPPTFVDLAPAAINVTVRFSGTLLADNAGWIRRASDGESWTVVH